MKASELEREIEVVNQILKQLNQCLVIFKKEKMKREINLTVADIYKCRIELKRLIRKRHAEIQRNKGATKDDATIQ